VEYLDQLLADHAPRVATRTHELTGALDDVVARVVAEATVPQRARRRRTRTVAIGLAAATALSVGSIAAADVPWHFPWSSGADVKSFRTASGVDCDMVFTVSSGVETGGDMAEAKRVARQVLADFRLDPSRLPRPAYADPQDEAAAFYTIARGEVADALNARGLPEVNVQAESPCEGPSEDNG
jgi:hypothetical protein